MSVSIITLKSDMKNAKKKNVDKQEFLVDVQRHYCGVSFECEKQVYRVGTAYNFFGAKNILKGAMFNEPQYTYSVLSSFFFLVAFAKGVLFRGDLYLELRVSARIGHTFFKR